MSGSPPSSPPAARLASTAACALALGWLAAGCAIDGAADDRGPIGKADLTGSCDVDSCGDQSASGNCWCDSECEAIGDCCSDKRETCDAPVAALTYNAGLARGAVTFTEERLPHVIDALADGDADVVCLQEVWDDDDVERITEELADVYPHSAFEKTTDNSRHGWPQCNPFDLIGLNSCVSDCQAEGKSVFECVAADCKADYDELGDGCKLCLAANTTSPAMCSLPFLAKKYAWSGRNGMMMLSKAPIDSVAYDAYDTLLIKRGVLSAEIDGLTYQCTHMSADLGSVPYPADERDFNSWAEEQRAQVDVIAGAAPANACTVLLGDLNSGIQTDVLDAEVPESFNALVDAGYAEPWDQRACTHCSTNPLVGGDHSSQIDHAMFRNCNVEPSYQVVLDGELGVEADGQKHQTRLSDHYGLRAVF